MAKNLLIVESPAKAKTIEKILGKDFKVESCFGHIRDLEKAEMGIDIQNGFKPKYKVADDKKKVVKELKSRMKDSEEVWLATDEDREGEAISWHLCEVLKLDPRKTKRIVFHEITKPAIQEAVAHPRNVNLDLVNAQQARRVLDRIVGFQISPILWRKISMKNNLSAGRVQSVAVRLIVEREREIKAFTPEASFKVSAELSALDKNGKDITFKADLAQNLKSLKEAQDFLNNCVQAEFTVEDIQVKPAKKSPSAPFTTSTLQQEAGRKLGYSVSKTMLLAQKLYESGKITYMRTDAVNLSDTALTDIRNQIETQFGKEYHEKRIYKNKNSNAQEAHEAIRPTAMSITQVENMDQQRLYSLIWNRTMACQMADAQIEKTIAKIGISTSDKQLTAKGEVLKFEGFLKLYMEGRDEDEDDDENTEGILPPLQIGQKTALIQMTAKERFTRSAPRYTEASLVKKLEELGIGRPSTYAPTISTIQNRTYVEKTDREGISREFSVVVLKDQTVQTEKQTEMTGFEKNKLFPTDLGMIVTDFLNEHFTQVMDYKFTAKIEEEFDEIAEGKKEWNKVIGEFYTPFKEKVEGTLETASVVSGERSLGEHPDSKEPIIARMGRYGPMVQMGVQDDEKEIKPKYAKLQKGQSIETITLDEALNLFLLPREIGQFEDLPIIINIGRFGPYAQHDGLFYSLGKEMDPYSVTFEEVQPMIVEKREEKRKSTIKVFEKEKIKVLIGPYGPYIKQGLRNYKIPKEKIDEPEKLTLEECMEIIEEAKKNPPKRVPRKKS